MKKYLAAAMVIGLLAMFIPGCSAGPFVQNEPASGNLRLMVSDEPNDIGDFYSVKVTISNIGFQEKDADGFTEYEVNPPRTVDLTKLQGKNASEVWEGPVVSGNYTKVFVYVDNVTGILNGAGAGQDPVAGENVTVKLPSGKLQISKAFEVKEDGTITFVFDITVIKAGQSGKYILKPQIAESGADQPVNDVTPAAGQANDEDSNGKGEGQKPEGVPVGREGDQPGKGKRE
jgi:hypothetical protein